MIKTMCWHCNALYLIEANVCPKCGVSNANTDPEVAITQYLDFHKRNHKENKNGI